MKKHQLDWKVGKNKKVRGTTCFFFALDPQSQPNDSNTESPSECSSALKSDVTPKQEENCIGMESGIKSATFFQAPCSTKLMI